MTPVEPARRIVVTRNNRAVTEADVRGVVTIGRHPKNTILLDDKDVSRWHALIFLDPRGHSHLQDLGSSNGTLMDGHPISRVRLKPGDTFTVGGFHCRLEEQGAAGHAPGHDTQATTLGTSFSVGLEPKGFLGKSQPAELLMQQILRLAPLDCDVLITGETGSGKGMVARLLHDLSPRAQGPFIAVNCAAIPAELEESEFFGHRRGSFTGAIADHRGAFEEANGGTLFLDEIGDMNLRTQAKILKAVEEKKVLRVGDSKRTPVDLNIRIVAATHRDLEASSGEQFREDLYYRLARATVRVPALRDRPDDVILLANHFLVTVGAEMPAAQGRTFSAAARKALSSHSWPGNVRELENVVRHALLWATGPTIEPADLDLRRRAAEKAVSYVPDRPLADAIAEVECAYIRGALEHHDWNIAKTARLLKIGPNRLRDRMERYQLREPGQDDD